MDWGFVHKAWDKWASTNVGSAGPEKGRSLLFDHGKVLMTGGYLILERPNAGVVLSTNARFYAIVKPLYDELKPDSWSWVMVIVSTTYMMVSNQSIHANLYNSR